MNPPRATTPRPPRRPPVAACASGKAPFARALRRLAARCLLAPALLAVALPSPGQKPPAPAALKHSVEQLRASIGRWSVTTDFLRPDGSVAKSVKGSYEFSWVVPDRVAAGRSDNPEIGQSSAILFYVNENAGRIEMASVGGDGRLWIMTGPLGGEVRESQPYATAGGGTGRLRFTRSAVTANAFESRMEYTEDGGKTWVPGNRQRFRRAATAKP
ncbi:MAG: hypothetical protein AB7I06_17390 [Burkholderiales bacterium]